LGAAASAQTVLDIDTAKRLSVVLLSKGQGRAAHDILTTLHAHHPGDVEIVVTLSRAKRAIGKMDEAIAMGRGAFAMAKTPREQFMAAKVTAEALASDGQHTRAMIWLRRAGHAAPNDAAERAIRRDYNYVRSRNPLAFHFSGSVSPTDNANDAPTTNEIVIGGLTYVDPTAEPIPGTEFTFSATGVYRLPATAYRQTQLSLGYHGRRVDLGAEAARIDPDLKDSDFSSDRIELGWSGKFRQSADGGVSDAMLRLFADWNGGDRSQNGAKVSAGHKFKVGDGQTLRLGGAVERLNRLDNSLRSSTTYTLSADWSWRMASRDSLSLGMDLTDTSSESSAVAHDGARVRIGYDFGTPVLGAFVGFRAEYQYSNFDTPLYSAAPRQDDKITFSAHATLPRLSAYGFAPVISLTHERTHSNVASFDQQSTQLSLSVRSTY